jgi:hypothetical protein
MVLVESGLAGSMCDIRASWNGGASQIVRSRDFRDDFRAGADRLKVSLPGQDILVVYLAVHVMKTHGERWLALFSSFGGHR